MPKMTNVKTVWFCVEIVDNELDVQDVINDVERAVEYCERGGAGLYHDHTDETNEERETDEELIARIRG